MLDLSRIPFKLNGFQVTAILPASSGFEVVILGHDPRRRNGKYVTALVDPRPRDTEVTEWYFGHYFETLQPALRSLIRRSGADVVLCPHALKKPCPIPGCIAYNAMTEVGS